MEAAAEKAAGEVFLRRWGSAPASHDRIIKVARTIADLDGSDIITAAHLAEAVQLRTSLKFIKKTKDVFRNNEKQA